MGFNSAFKGLNYLNEISEVSEGFGHQTVQNTRISSFKCWSKM